MKIKSLSVWRAALTSHETYNMAGGKSCATVNTHVLRIRTDTGLDGWGECCPIPHYLPAYGDGIPPAIAECAEVLLGADPVGPDALMARVNAHLQGHRYAKSAIDIALHDLTARAANLPLYALLGGARQASLPLYHSITCVAPDDMARMAREAYASGIRQFQVKLGADDNWEADVARMHVVREAVGPGPIVYGDWNCGATQLTATRVARAVAHLDVMIEQPCETIAECAVVKRATGLAMKLDEVAHDIDSLLAGANAGVLDAVAIKLSKFGGLGAARRARDLAAHLGAMMCVECTWGSDIVTAASLHLATATEPKNLLNTCDLSGYVAPRIAPDAPSRRDGRIAPPEGPGLGVTPDMDILGAPIAEFS